MQMKNAVMQRCRQKSFPDGSENPIVKGDPQFNNAAP